MTVPEVEFVCEGCGCRVRTYRFINYRTIPPTIDERDLCFDCKERAVHPERRGPTK